MGNDPPDLSLLLFNGPSGVDDDKAKFVDHVFILFDDPGLEQVKAFLNVIA
jgi:hypothetical protein